MSAKQQILLLLCFLIPGALSAQIIYQEPFNYADGTTSGPASSWTSSCPACVSGDYLEVRNNAFEGRDLNDWAFFQTQAIDISSCSGTIDFSLLAAESGDHEGPGCNCMINIDYFDVYYSLDGGPFTVIEDWQSDGDVGHTLTGDSLMGVFTDDDWGSTTVTQTVLSGNTMQLRIEMRNTAGSEALILDDIVVTCVTLPVEMLHFGVTDRDDHVELNWETSMETNNKGFQIQRSFNGVSFFSVGEVAGAGDSDERQVYSFRDPVDAEGTIYYRLRQEDLDGTFNYTEIVSVTRHRAPLALSALYPNPVQNQLHLALYAEAPMQARAEVLDLLGQRVQEMPLDLTEGQQAVTIPADGLSAGVYMLRLVGTETVITRRFRVE
ncbi:MAG: T9SS type A sorting domain-containing protein [Bacteroidota bacterium]